MNAGVVVCNEKGELVLFNQVAREWHGLDPLKIPQAEWADHYNLYMPDGITPMDVHAIPLVRSFHGEKLHGIGLVIAAKGQPKRHVLNYSAPIQGKDGRILGAIAVFHDITERKLIEESLRESEDRYRRLMGSTIDYIYTVQLMNGRAVETTHGPGCLAVTGYSCEEYKADEYLWYRMVHQDDRSRVVDIGQRIVKGFPVEPYEHRIYHRKGTIRWLRNTIVVKKNEKGQVVSYDGLVVDITDRKLTEIALKESEVRFSTIFRVTPVGVALVRKSDNKFVDVNNSFSGMFGYLHDEFIGHTSMELGLWVSLEEREQMIRELNKHGQLQQYEFRIRRKSGEIGDSILSAGSVTLENQEHYLFVTMDVTESLKARQKLKEAAEVWEKTFDAIPDMIFILDKDTNILKVNKTCAHVLKMSPKDIIGKKFYDIALNLSRSWPSCRLEENKIDYEIHTEEVNDPHLGISLQVTVSPIFDNNGEFLGAVHVAKDITKFKKSEIEKKEHLRELEIFYKGSVGREERILQLKENIVHLKAQISALKKDG